MKLHWTRLALQDLKHLHDYIADDNPNAARQTVGRIQEAGQHLKNHPYLGKPGRVPETYELFIAGTPYLVVYSLSKTKILIVTVLHTAMRWPDSPPHRR